jgi:hypothetical protein
VYYEELNTPPSDGQGAAKRRRLDMPPSDATSDLQQQLHAAVQKNQQLQAAAETAAHSGPPGGCGVCQEKQRTIDRLQKQSRIATTTAPR